MFETAELAAEAYDTLVWRLGWPWGELTAQTYDTLVWRLGWPWGELTAQTYDTLVWRLGRPWGELTFPEVESRVEADLIGDVCQRGGRRSPTSRPWRARRCALGAGVGAD
jgi:hypothetical protein